MADNNQIKGTPVRVFDRQAIAARSRDRIDCRGFNAVNVHAQQVGGTSSPSCTITIRGTNEEGGNYLQLPDADANAKAITSAGACYDVIVGTAWAELEIASLAGSYGAHGGWIVTVTPYVSPGYPKSTVELSNVDDLADASAAAIVAAQGEIHGGASTDPQWVRPVSGGSVVILALLPRTAAQVTAQYNSVNLKALMLFVRVSAVTGAPAIIPYLELMDPLSGQYVTVWQAAVPIDVPALYLYALGDGGAAGGSYTEKVQLTISTAWRASVSHANSDSITCSVMSDRLPA